VTHNVEHQFDLNRILICGLGSIGRRHARIFNELIPGIDLSVYRSGHGKSCPELELMSNHFSDITTAIGWKPDAAVIATPAPFHQYQALMLARHGIPLLIEKPVGVGTECQAEWDELLHYSKNQTIAVGYVLRHDPCASYVKEKIDSLELGQLLEADFYCGSWLPEWRPESDYRECVSSRKSMGGGALLEISHEIDLAYWFFGNLEIDFANLKKSGLLDIDVEDQVFISGHSAKCLSITLRMNFCTMPPRRSVLLRFEKGEITWSILKGEVQVYTSSRGTYKFTIEQDKDERYRSQAKNFMSSICSNQPLSCSLHDGLKVMKIINTARVKAMNPEMQ